MTRKRTFVCVGRVYVRPCEDGTWDTHPGGMACDALRAAPRPMAAIEGREKATSGSAPAIPLTQSQMEDFKGNHWLSSFETVARRREEEKNPQTCLDKEVQTGSLFCYTLAGMKFYQLELCGLKRRLPIVALSPKIKIASFNLLGDVELVRATAEALAKKLKKFEIDFLVGPEVKVVPLLQELSKILGKERYIICRKQIRGYMVKPLVTKTKPRLVLDGIDKERLAGKKVAVVDDVISTGRTIKVVRELMEQAGAEVSCVATVLKQGETKNLEDEIIFLGQLPVFREESGG